MRFSHPPRSLATTNGITICFLLLRVLRCFTSPRSLPPAIHSPAGDTTSLVPGFPIRTSSDPRSVDNSPRHIAASHVLHRLLMPRHPPYALTHLQTQKPKNTRQTKQPHNTIASLLRLLRCSQPLSTTQTPHPTTKMRRQHHPHGPYCLRTQQCAQQPAPTQPSTDHAGTTIACCHQTLKHRPTPTIRHRPHSSTAHTPTSSKARGKNNWCSLERR